MNIIVIDEGKKILKRSEKEDTYIDYIYGNYVEVVAKVEYNFKILISVFHFSTFINKIKVNGNGS